MQNTGQINWFADDGVGVEQSLTTQAQSTASSGPLIGSYRRRSPPQSIEGGWIGSLCGEVG